MVWVEAQSDLVKDLVNSLPAQTNTVIEAVVWDEGGVELLFNISSNGQSSSLLDFGSDAETYPEIKYVNHITVSTKRLDDKVPLFPFADFLNLDIQGVEFKAL